MDDGEGGDAEGDVAERAVRLGLGGGAERVAAFGHDDGRGGEQGDGGEQRGAADHGAISCKEVSGCQCGIWRG